MQKYKIYLYNAFVTTNEESDIAGQFILPHVFVALQDASHARLPVVIPSCPTCGHL